MSGDKCFANIHISLKDRSKDLRKYKEIMDHYNPKFLSLQNKSHFVFHANKMKTFVKTLLLIMFPIIMPCCSVISRSPVSTEVPVNNPRMRLTICSSTMAVRFTGFTIGDITSILPIAGER